MSLGAEPYPERPPIRVLIADDHPVYEHYVLNLIAAGHNNSAIAERLALSEKTVRNNVSSIFAKLQVADRPSAIVRAREAGLGSA